jgi:hypothetical protein
MREHQRDLLFLLAAVASVAGSAHSLASSPVPTVEYIGRLEHDLPGGITFGGDGQGGPRIAVSGSRAVVGAGLFRTVPNLNHAFVYDFSDPQNIRRILDLTPPDSSFQDEFGDSVAIAGNYVFVSAWGDASSAGAVYMYDISDPLNVVRRKIQAFDGEAGSYFGFSMAVDGTKLIVGAPKYSVFNTLPEAAYVIDFADPDHLRQTKLTSDTPGLVGAFGENVAISGNRAIVASSSEDGLAGAAYLYDITDFDDIRSKRLKPTDAPANASFGGRVAISGTKALVSASELLWSNGVWAFDFTDWENVIPKEYGRTAQPESSLPSLDGGLSIRGNLAVAGATSERSFEGQPSIGAVYFHDLANVGDPRELLRLPPQEPSDSSFGAEVAFDGRALLVSDYGRNVYLYHVIPEPSGASLSIFGLIGASARRRRHADHCGSSCAHRLRPSSRS